MSSIKLPFATTKNFSILKDFQRILPKNKVIAEYIWIGGKGEDIRGKSRIIDIPLISDISELPDWSFDGSSTSQAEGGNSDILLKPVKYVPCPFRRNNHIIVLCETFDCNYNAIQSNRRSFARSIMDCDKVRDSHAWFGLEQEYTLFTADGVQPLGFPYPFGSPSPQGQYYCSVGANNAFGRHLSDAHLYACLYSGLDIGGTNAEVMPGQWEYQIGPCEGMEASDQLWIARYIMERLAEDFEVLVSLQPKPLTEWNGAGCHCNFSTQQMRDENGIDIIMEAMVALEKTHDEHMKLYGDDNHLRMTGLHETSSYHKFTFGIADRGKSVRIPRQTGIAKCGYLEDRRPSANCDPYNVTAMMCKSIIKEGMLK